MTMATMKKRRAEFLEALIDHIAHDLIAIGLPQEEAAKRALASANAFTERCNSGLIYIPKNTQLETEAAYQQIRDEFTGNNHKELADKHGKHPRTIYKILKEEK